MSKKEAAQLADKIIKNSKKYHLPMKKKEKSKR